MSELSNLIKPQRLKGESFADYKQRRADANTALKAWRQGRLIWESIKIVELKLNAKGFPVFPGMAGEDGVVARTLKIRKKVDGTYNKHEHGPIGTPSFKAA